MEVAYGIPDQGTPSGIFDQEGERADPNRGIRAGITSGGLTVSLYPSSASYLPYDLSIVNILGQTIVSKAGMADFGQITIPWSADRPSGVYFCRIRLGQVNYTVPVVNLK